MSCNLITTYTADANNGKNASPHVNVFVDMLVAVCAAIG